MYDWLVTVTSTRGPTGKRRVFVENVENLNEAGRLAMLKLGAIGSDFEAKVELIDIRVSPENPNDNLKNQYEALVIDLADVRRELEISQGFTSTYFERMEQAEKERDRVIERHDIALTYLVAMQTIFDTMRKGLEKKIR